MSDLIKLANQRFNAIEANLLVELVNQLLIVYWHVSVSIAQVVQNVAEVGAIAINKIPTILISGDIVAA